MTTLSGLECLTDFKQSVVEYIGGFVVRRAKSMVKCAECSSSLLLDKSDRVTNLINTKDQGGLIQPSDSVIKVCSVAEQCIQHVEKTKGIPRTSGNIVNALCSTVFKVVGESYPWCFKELDTHTLDFSVLNNHKHELIKTIAICYIKLRLHHMAKRHSQNIEVYSYKLGFYKFFDCLKDIRKFRVATQMFQIFIYLLYFKKITRILSHSQARFLTVLFL
jgi:hypothetical protein